MKEKDRTNLMRPVKGSLIDLLSDLTTERLWIEFTDKTDNTDNDQ